MTGDRLTYSNWSPGYPKGSSDPMTQVDEVGMRTTGHIDQGNYRPGQWFDADPKNYSTFAPVVTKGLRHRGGFLGSRIRSEKYNVQETKPKKVVYILNISC